MKRARLAAGYAKLDDCYLASDLSATNFGQMFSPARNQMLFLSSHILLSLIIFFNLLHSISKIALPRYSSISYKNLNG